MTKLTIGMLAAVCSVGVLAGCAPSGQQPPPQTPPKEEAPRPIEGLSRADLDSIRNLGSQYNPALRTEDLAKAVDAIYVDDALLLPPDAKPLKGRQAVLEHLRKLGASNWNHRALATVGRGDVAYELSQWTLTTGQGDTAVKVSGVCMDILRKMPDGGWKVVAEMYSQIPEAQMSEVASLVTSSTLAR